MIFAVSDNAAILTLVQDALDPLPVQARISADEVLPELVAACERDETVVLICNLRSSWDGMHLCQNIKERAPTAQILVLSARDAGYEPERISGVSSGFLFEDATPEVLRREVQRLHQAQLGGETPLLPVDQYMDAARFKDYERFRQLHPYSVFVVSSEHLSSGELLTSEKVLVDSDTCVLPLAEMPDLGPRTMTIGRSPRCDFRLPCSGVSRIHAYLTIDDSGGLWISDADSTFGTTLGEKKLEPRVKAKLENEAEVYFGPVPSLFFRSPGFFHFLLELGFKDRAPEERDEFRSKRWEYLDDEGHSAGDTIFTI